ncbi:MAG: FAD-dependent oxidoreductase [Blastocatellia bacterium]|nr:MAG: FAD-dependent oxidoreductase [Blastocatellia bacterium]
MCVVHFVKEYPYWWDVPSGPENPKRRTEPSLPARADVAIVGGGYTGLSAARELARRGASVVVLERGSVGSGASGRNAGQVLTGLKLSPMTLVARFGRARARQLFDISLEAIATLESLLRDEEIECEYERTGHLEAASKPSHFNALHEQQAILESVFHHSVRVIPRANQHTEIGTSKYFGVMVDGRSAAIDPAQYVRQLAAAARRSGAVILEDTDVTAMARHGAAWHVNTSRGAMQAGEVLVATNGYTDQTTAWLQRRFVAIGSYVIATASLHEDRALALLPKRRMAFDSRHFLHYFRLTRDFRLLFGGRAEFTTPTGERTRRSARILQQDMISIFPSLASVPIEYAWGGNVAFTRNQLPHAGRFKGAHYAGGYSGHGVAMSTYLGGLTARRMSGEAFEHPFFDEDDSYPAIPFYRGTPWFLPLAGAYYKLKDWVG